MAEKDCSARDTYADTGAKESLKVLELFPPAELVDKMILM